MLRRLLPGSIIPAALLLTLVFGAATSVAAQTPLPTLPVTLTVVTGGDGTNDTPTITLKNIDGIVLGASTLDQPGDLGPGATNVYNFSVSANFCDITQYELTKPASTPADDPWQISQLRLSIDGVEVWFSTSFGSPITSGSSHGGSWQGTHAYRDRCGVLAWTLVEVQFVTGPNGTNDDLNFEISGTFDYSPYTQVLSIPGDLQPGQTDDYVFIVPMEFCEMTGFTVRKPPLGAVDDDWAVDDIRISIDGTEVFVDLAAEDLTPLAAGNSFGGTWNGTAAYTDRCSGGGLSRAPIDPIFEIDPSHLIEPMVTLPAGRLIDLPGLRAPNLQLVLPATATPTPAQGVPIQQSEVQIQPLATATWTLPPPPNPAQPTQPPPPPQQPQGQVTCPGFLPSRLVVGQTARVTPGAPNNVRSGPSLQAQLVGQIPGSAAFLVVSGPQCADGIAWWQVNYQGLIGWTAEGQGNEYWTEPVQSVG